MNEQCKRLGHAWKCLRCGEARDGGNPNDLWKDLEQIMKPDTIYRLSEISVNADELRRIKDELDEQLASGLALYRRVENLINQGTITTHANKEEACEYCKKGRLHPNQEENADNDRARDTII